MIPLDQHPEIIVRRNPTEEGYLSLCGIRLHRLLYTGSSDDVLPEVRHYAELLRFLSRIDTVSKFSIRYVVPGSKELLIVLLLRLQGANNEQLRGETERLTQAVLSFLKIYFREQEFVPLQDNPSLAEVLSPFRIEDSAEIARRVARLSIASWEVTREVDFGYRTANVNCSQDSRRGNEEVQYVFPFISTLGSLNHLCEHLVLRREPCLVDISFTPIKHGDAYGDVPKAMEESLALCEDYLRSAASFTRRTVLSTRANALRQFFFAQRHLLDTPGNAMLVRIRIASPGPTDPSLMEAVGNSFTAPVSACDAQAPYLAGGFESWHCVPDEKLRSVLSELRQEDTCDDAIRYWFDAESAGYLLQFPRAEEETFPGIPVYTARVLRASQALPQCGTLMGEADVLGEKATVRLPLDDHRRHVYVIGQTGVGKTSLILSMVMDHVRNGQGLAVLDPHGDLINHVVTRMPERRLSDVILFDPGDAEYPIGLNLLEWSTEDQKGFIVDEMISMLQRMYLAEHMGPVFFHNVRFGLLLLMANREDIGTLVEFPHLFSDTGFHRRWLEHLHDPLAIRFWTKEFPKTDYGHENYMHYIVSKFDPFISHPLMRNVIGQRRSAIDFEAVINGGKILLVNLSKGKLGELNSSMLGRIIVAKLYAAAMRRVNLPMAERRDFFVYVDEFQNLATETFAHILSEARKFRMNLTLCNQYVAQLPLSIINALLGNVGTLAAFRVGLQDADVLKGYFEPAISSHALTGQPNYHAYLRLLVDGRLTPPFSLNTALEPSPDKRGGDRIEEQVITHSRQQYGRERAVVEEEIARSLEVSTVTRN